MKIKFSRYYFNGWRYVFVHENPRKSDFLVSKYEQKKTANIKKKVFNIFTINFKTKFLGVKSQGAKPNTVFYTSRFVRFYLDNSRLTKISKFQKKFWKKKRGIFVWSLFPKSDLVPRQTYRHQLEILVVQLAAPKLFLPIFTIKPAFLPIKPY